MKNNLVALPYLFCICQNRIRQFLSTVWSRVYASWWGVQLGPFSRFFGFPIFRRHPTASICIGSHSLFRSSEWSNTIGLNRRCFISASRNACITIGNHCGFSATVISASNSIIVGDFVICGGNCTIVDTDRHPVHPIDRIKNAYPGAIPITIGNNVFLGMNVLVLKGSIIGNNTTIAANSVVTGNIPDGVLAGGIPAKVIKHLTS